MRHILRLLLSILFFAPTPAVAQSGQIAISRIEKMPNLPSPYTLRDWNATARAYDRLVFDADARGEFLPILWWDDTHVNGEGRMFGLPSYVGHSTMHGGADHEAINCLGAVLGATIAGIDKSRGPTSWVEMVSGYYQAKTTRLVLNRSNATTGQSFWYELFPQIVFAQIADRYPRNERLQRFARDGAEQWYNAAVAMGGKSGRLNTEGTAFDFATMRLVDNGRWKEPDATAGIAYLSYLAFCKTGEPRFRNAADWGLTTLERRTGNPLYEVLFLYAPIVAARMNAEQGRAYDIGRLLEQNFTEGSDARPGWGVIVGKWGDCDVSGLLGSVTDGGGYAFTMNTFVGLGALLPVARYDTRFARSLGKWALNAINAARLFYPDALPPNQQTGPAWKVDRARCVAYEGLRRTWQGVSPCATGDAVRGGWGKTDLGLYGSSYVGLLAGIVAPTDVERILHLDLLATDFARPRAYPTYLYFNPYAETKTVTLTVGAAPCDLYDAVRHVWLQRAVRKNARISLPANQARVIVLVPAGGKVIRQGKRVKVNGVVIDYGVPER